MGIQVRSALCFEEERGSYKVFLSAETDLHCGLQHLELRRSKAHSDLGAHVAHGRVVQGLGFRV